MVLGLKGFIKTNVPSSRSVDLSGPSAVVDGLSLDRDFPGSVQGTASLLEIMLHFLIGLKAKGAIHISNETRKVVVKP